MGVPNAFSKTIGEGTSDVERLINRGACISWSPKNLASSFLVWCIKWMVKNTRYRLFTAYSDPSARELGTIYQACNFYYMGQASGTISSYISPFTGKTVSSRYFRQKTIYRKVAENLGIVWQSNWNHRTGMHWCNMPIETEELIRKHAKILMNSAEKVETIPKHKYAYVLGVDKRETIALRKMYEKRNKIRQYPKNRGHS